MFCPKCGYKLIDEKVTKCPFCQTDLTQKESVEVKKEENIFESYESSNQEITPEVNETNYSFDTNNLDETTMAKLRNPLGYLNIGSKWWYHLLIALIGYGFMEFGASILLILLARMGGVDFTCLTDDSCPVETMVQLETYSAIAQVICEIILVVAVIILFRKQIKHVFEALKSSGTWKWIGIGLAITYGASFIYSTFLQILNLESTSANQESLNSIIYDKPLLGLLFVVIAAPLFEELIFRFGVFRSFTFNNRKTEIIGFVVTTLAFAFMHMIATFQVVFEDPNNIDTVRLVGDLLTLPVYLIGAFSLTFVYYKTKNIGASMAMHMIYNGISFVLILLTSGLEIEAIFNLLTRLWF